MPGLPSEVDVAVIGAGAAGIAAGRRLAEAKRASFVVLEARERSGGRAWTVEKDGLPLDLGCEWLHSACAVQRRRFPVGASPTRRHRSRRKRSEQSWR